MSNHEWAEKYLQGVKAFKNFTLPPVSERRGLQFSWYKVSSNSLDPRSMLADVAEKDFGVPIRRERIHGTKRSSESYSEIFTNAEGFKFLFEKEQTNQFSTILQTIDAPLRNFGEVVNLLRNDSYFTPSERGNLFWIFLNRHERSGEVTGDIATLASERLGDTIVEPTREEFRETIHAVAILPTTSPWKIEEDRLVYRAEK